MRKEEDNMKKVLFFITLFVMSMFAMPNVYADTADDAAALTRLLGAQTPTIELEAGQEYVGNFTIQDDVEIVGHDAKINGTFTVTGGTKVSISGLTMTGSLAGGDSPYIDVTSTQAAVDLTLSNVTIYYGEKDDSSSFTSKGTGVKVSLGVKEGTKVTITDSVIQAKYAVWMQGGDSELVVKDSELSGYAALDLTSSQQATSGNKVTIDNSVLTGYSVGTSDMRNDYGTIVVGNKTDVTIDIKNNSEIRNNFDNANGARSDLILMSDYEGKDVTDVTVTVTDSKLINTDDELGAVYNANGKEENSFEAENTVIEGNLIAGETEYVYVEFVVDGKSNVVLVKKNTKLAQSDIPKVSKKGYTFDGWFDAKGKLFNAEAAVAENMTVTAKFTKVPSEETNPATGDSVLTHAVVCAIALISVCGLTICLKKVSE